MASVGPTISMDQEDGKTALNEKDGDDASNSNSSFLMIGGGVTCLVLIAGVIILVLALLPGSTDETKKPGEKPGKPGEKPPALNTPLPYLKWDEGAAGEERFGGTLDVPLNPLDDESPMLKLLLKVRPSPTQPAPLGPMLVHCGGPGSTKECLDYLVPTGATIEKDLADKYDLFAIDQRGIGGSEPVMNCDGKQAVLPPISSERANPTDFFPTCPCEGYTSPNVRFTSNTDWAASFEFFNNSWAVNQACYKADFLQKDKYNVMDYLGTSFLAHDLDRFRQAIGAKKLSVMGLGYGTWVGSVYASIYPENVDKLVIFRNLPPSPNVPDFSRQYALSQQGVRAEQVSRCRELGTCGSRDPEESFRSVTEMLENGDFKAQSNFGPVTLSPRHVTQDLHGLLNDPTQRVLAGNTDQSNQERQEMYKGFAMFISMMLDLPTEADRTAYTETALNFYCALDLPVSMQPQCKDSDGTSLAIEVNTATGMFKCPTWKQYGVCVYNSAVPGSMQFALMYWGVFAGDVPTRFLPSQMVDLEQRLTADFGVVGAGAAFVQHQTAMWPSEACYPGIGTSAIKPLIMSTLDDSSTGFYWTQEMKLAFPASRLVTFQDNFLGFPSPFMKQDSELKGIDDCWQKLQNYVGKGELPRNGDVCHVNPDLNVSYQQVRTWDFLPEPREKRKRSRGPPSA